MFQIQETVLRWELGRNCRGEEWDPLCAASPMVSLAFVGDKILEMGLQHTGTQEPVSAASKEPASIEHLLYARACRQ